MPMQLFYTGIGSRHTPTSACLELTRLARWLYSTYGFILRSGGAKGADQACEDGAPVSHREIYVPSPRFERNLADYIVCSPRMITWDRAQTIAKHLHGNWEAPGMRAYNTFGQRAHTRNVFEVLGQTLTQPSNFVLCWAPWVKHNVSVSGGTNTAVTLALEYNLPIFNLIDGNNTQDRIRAYLAGGTTPLDHIN